MALGVQLKEKGRDKSKERNRKGGLPAGPAVVLKKKNLKAELGKGKERKKEVGACPPRGIQYTHSEETT